MDKNVLEWLARRAAEMPEKVCYEDDNISLTFAGVQRRVRTIGSFLLEQDTPAWSESPFAPVCVMSGRHVNTITAFLGVVYSGRCYAPIDAAIPEERIRTIVKTARPAAILADRAHIDRIESIGYDGPVYIIEDILEKNDAGTNEPDAAVMTETDPLYIIFTSGSTGVPKGVITSHHSLMTYIDAYEEVMQIDAADTLGSQSPLDYIAAIRDIYLPLRTGCRTYLIPKEKFMEPMALFKTMNDHHITAVGWSVSAFTVPVSLGAFKATGKDDAEQKRGEAKWQAEQGREKAADDAVLPRYLKKVCFSGSVMPGKVLRAWQTALPEARFVNQYGPTEATASCTYYPVDHLAEVDEVLPIGRPYRNYRIYLLNEDGTATAPGEEGEICVAGPILALGYYNNPERTARDFIQNPLNKSFRELIYKTGDYGALRPDGNLTFHGRKDRQIKHMGHRVELDEVDRAAQMVPGIKECCTVYNKAKEQIWLFYTGEATKRDISLTLRKTLPGFMIPRKIQPLEEIPRLPNGKIDMKTLEKMAAETK